MTNATDPAAGQGQPRVVTPEEIQRQEFGVSRFGGYRMRDVDEFLDHITASTQALLAENERLRGGAGPILGTSDLEDVNRQADEILQRAREEAGRIVAGASAQATAVPAGAEDRAAVDAFLSQERDFLQNLATLVQAHAETVKALGMRAVLGNGVACDLGCWMEACIAARAIDNAGEMNGFLKARSGLLTAPLEFEGGAIVLRPGFAPRLDYGRVAPYRLDFAGFPHAGAEIAARETS